MSKLKKIVSGGQTGVDRAAWDAALECGIPIEGWCPRGRRAEDGIIPDRYPCRETPLAAYEQRTSWNVRDSDGTLVITCGEPTGGTAYTIAQALFWKKPYLRYDICAEHPEMGIKRIRDWLSSHQIQVLNVAGPRERTIPGIYQQAYALLKRLFCSQAKSVPG